MEIARGTALDGSRRQLSQLVRRRLAERGALHVVRGTWSGQTQELHEPYRGLAQTPLVFAVHATGLHRVLIHPILSNIPLPRTKPLPRSEVTSRRRSPSAGTTRSTPNTQAATYVGVGRLAVASIEGIEIRTREYAPLAITGGGTTLADDMHDFIEEGTFTENDLSRPFVRLGSSRNDDVRDLRPLSLPKRSPPVTQPGKPDPHDLAVSSARQRSAIAIGFETGAMFLGGSLREDVRQTFAYDLSEPKLAFVGGNYLVAAAERGIEANGVEA